MKNWLPYFFLLLPFTVCAQTDYQERLYLHTDRTTYVTGETIWFSAYLLDATTNRLSNLSRQFYVELISVDNKPVLQQTVALRGGRGASSMQITDPLPTGRYQLRAYTNWMKNFAIRNFFTQEIIVLNPFVANKDSLSSSAPAIASNENTNKLTDFPLRLSTERLGRRQPLTISFENMPAAASLAITRIDQLPSPKPVSINDASSVSINDAGLIATQPAGSVINYLPEMEGPVLAGYLVDKTTGNRLKQQTAFLAAPGVHYSLTSSVSDENGKIFFNLPTVSQAKELVFHPVVSGNEQIGWEPQPVYVDNYNFPATASAPLIQDSTTEALVKERNLNSQLMAAFYPSSIDSTSFHPVIFGAPDNYYELDLYTRFPTMEEVIHEFIPEIRMRRADGKTRFNVKNNLFTEFFLNEPLILVDGVPVNNANDIMGLDPTKIKSISVYTRKMFLGPVVREGLIVLQTYKGDLNGFTVPKTDMVVQYAGIKPATLFAAPSYGGGTYQSARIPDRRSLLYWNGTLELAPKEITIYSSDLPGTYQIRLEGISPSGAFIHVEKQIIVQ